MSGTGKQALSFRVSGVYWSVHRGSRRLTGPPILYPEGRLSYCRHSWQDIPVWPYIFILSLHSEM